MPTVPVRRRRVVVLFVGAGLISSASAQLPPLPVPPVPPPNPITEAKRVLGKILFWDEQLSSDNTVACGTCHRPNFGGADPRDALHPGPDQNFGTPDDIFGSAGVVRMDAAGAYIEDPIFGDAPQVTNRSAQPIFMAAYAPLNFWDGRAGPAFVDPETGQTVIPAGGALEAQSIGPILNSIEMAHDGRTWDEVRTKLQSADPLELASDIPADVAAVLASNPSYPDLFAQAFGTPAITARRIAFAIATYERTLVPNQTPWDAFNAGNQNALTPLQRQGLNTFTAPGSNCIVCHGGSQFTNHTFRNIGLRPPTEDRGRQLVTAQPQDLGRFKTPSLRNVGLKSRFMHNGRLTSLEQVIDFYRRANGQVQFPQNQDPAVPAINIPPQAVAGLVDFLRNGLTDPRVANEIFPFDRPRLLSEIPPGDTNCDGLVTVADIAPFVAALTDPAAYEATFPDCTIYSADFNGDALITVGDISGFVAVLTGG